MSQPHDASVRTYDAVPPSVFDADPALGLDSAPRGGLAEGHPAGHSHQDTQPTAFVRPATEADLEALGQVHSAVMTASLDAAHRDAHGTALPASLTALLDPQVLAAGWREAVTAPPSPVHHLLVATQAGQVVGLVALAPSRGTIVRVDDAGAATDEPVPSHAEELGAEIVALGVLPSAQRAGHGSRLLAAASDVARADHATTLLAWAVRGDASLAGLLAQAGLERTGSTRQLPVGQGVVEECWAAALD